MLVVDANVLLYLVLEGPRQPLAEELRRDDGEWRTSTLAKYEALNALATMRRAAMLGAGEASAALGRIGDFCARAEIRTAAPSVLEAAHAMAISGYDAHYIVLARALRCPLVSEDGRLRRAAPDVARSMAEAVRALRG
ncbi:MAG: type II toxin-antitoxin system VapC family toxin [Burkholderiales bacterium]